MTASKSLFVYLAAVCHPGGRGGRRGGWAMWQPLHPTPFTLTPPSGTSVRAHETAGALQKPIIKAPGPLPRCLYSRAGLGRGV